MPRTTAQITIFMDEEGNIKAETTGANGSRKKINLPKTNWEQILETELIAQQLWLMDQEDRKKEQEREAQKKIKEAQERFLLNRHVKIWNNTALNHNRGGSFGEEFAKKTIGEKQPATSIMDLLGGKG